LFKPDELAYSIKEVRESIVISNSSIYKEIGEGRLRALWAVLQMAR
jgi:hypothetical protein